MIRWIQDRKWLSSLSLSLAAMFIFGGADLLLQGLEAFGVTAILALAVFFAVSIPQLSVALTVMGTVLEIVLGLSPVLGGLSAAISLFLIAAFASRFWYLVSLGVTVVAGLSVAWFNSISLPMGVSVYGLVLQNDFAKASAFLFLSLFVISGNVLFWLLGRLAITYEIYVGTDFDRALSAQTQAKLSLEVAEQNERFEIARDISELIVQKVSSVLSQAEGGTYAVKADPSSALRSLERVTTSARAAHSELRRLFDMLNKSHRVSAAPPGLDELESLVVAYRELGFDVSLSHEGPRFSISDGAALALYRIVFDALANVKQNCIVGTNVSIDFSWVSDGVQVLIKDNGLETKRRSSMTLEELGGGYTVEDDVRALTEVIIGAGITAMRERAALYGGSIEATRVPGVGFTVSAIFPQLKSLAGTS